MQNFVYYAPTEIIFGKDTEKRVAEAVKKWGGSRVFIVYGGGSVLRSGLLERVKNELDQAKIAYAELGGVKPNPRLSLAEEGVKKACEFGADFVLAVGGGSVIDTAKGIAIGTCYPDENLWDIWTKKVKVEKALPVGSILTIAAAGSEMSSSAVLTNEKTGKKTGLGTELNRPKFAIMNPELTYTLPKYQVACGVVDIMMHTLERYFALDSGSHMMTDEIAEGLLRTVTENGLKAMEDTTNYDAMSEIMWCGSLSHNDITGLGIGRDFSVHKFGHELSAMFDVAHGASLSAMWATWARYVCETDFARFKRLGEKVWGLQIENEREAAYAAIDATESYFRSIHMPTCIGDLECGVLSDEVLRELAERTTNYGKIKIGTFKPIETEEVYNIYKNANHK